MSPERLLSPEQKKLAAAGLSGALLLLVSQQVFELAQRVAKLEARAEFFFGPQSQVERKLIEESKEQK